ncbi:MAG TPA: CRISPR system precrRNA processing endoribonuclease RAMP protein Cas6 [Anaerovoracaceae bacterium]|nr:CRISPR system precrRNA processing endoribonuclease RAMP protein Cas6 [Anaerovoracaceae bacterium]
MIFIALCIYLEHDPDRILTAADGVDVHRWFLQAVSRKNAELGKTIHDIQKNKRFSLGFVSSRDGLSILRIAFWGEEGIQLLNTLGTFFNQYTEMMIGLTNCSIRKVDFFDPQWGGMSSWHTFLADDKTVSSVYCEFLSPMAIMKDGINKKFRYSQTLPDPLSIFCGLQWRWKQLGGPAIPDGVEEFLKNGCCRVSYFDIYTVEFMADGRTQIGCIGRVAYQIDPDPVLSPVFGALARFAAYVGIGYQTARGMGLVKVGVDG